MNIQSIESKIRAFFTIDDKSNNNFHVEIIDNSDLHRNHKAMRELRSSGGSHELSHLTITIISDKFEGIRTLQRHQIVNKLLVEEFKIIHSISLTLAAPSELN